MSWELGLRIAQFVFAIGGTLVLIGRFWERSERPQTKRQGDLDDAALRTLIDALEKRTGALEMRFERASAEMSKLASSVQGLDSRLRADFMDAKVCAATMHESEQDRRLIRDEMARLWNAVTNGRTRMDDYSNSHGQPPR